MASSSSVLDFPRQTPAPAERVSAGESELVTLQAQLRDLTRQRVRDTVWLFVGQAVLPPTRWSRSHPELYLIAFWVFPAVVGGLAFIGLCELTMQVTFATFCGWAVALGGMAFLLSIRFINLNALELSVSRQRDRLNSLLKEDKNKRRQLAELHAVLRAEQLPQTPAALERHGELLPATWRDLRKSELADYVKKVLTTLGAEVETTPTAGEQAAELIATIGQRRVAVHVDRYLGTAGTTAVQQVRAGAKRQSCQACAIITNGRFTRAAIELANVYRCTLVDEDNFAQFAQGKISV